MILNKYLWKYKKVASPIYILSLMILFWAIFDGIMTYLVPILLSQNNFSMTLIGFIIGTSSITGVLFDVLVCRFFRNTNFRRVFLLMFLACLIYPLILWKASSILVYLVAMALWGIYFDLSGFGIFDFVSIYTKKKEYSSNFGIIQIAKYLGIILAPTIAGLLIIDGITFLPFIFGWIFLIISIIFFITLNIMTGGKVRKKETKRANFRNIFLEFRLWRKIGKKIFPVLAVTFFAFFIESFFWTLAPLYAEEAIPKYFGGLFLTAYALPTLILGWYTGKITKRLGKKKTAFLGLLIGCFILSFFYFWSTPITIILLTFLSACFINLALPSINGAYADYISETQIVEKEIESLEDSSFNFAYIFGPMIGGLLADLIGIKLAFSILGIAGVIIAIFLLIITPKKIKIDIKPSDLK